MQHVFNLVHVRFAILTSLFISSFCYAQDPWKNVYRESAWQERDQWQRPEELIRLMRLQKGSTVADIGCNEGYMTVKLAAAVSPGGRVYAVDVSQSKLDLLRKHLSDRRILNVTTIKGDYDDPKLPTGRLDAVIILDTYHEMDDHDAILAHIKECLKPDGRLVLCEPIADERRKLPRRSQEQRHELGMDFALADLEKAGFEIERKQDPFVDRTKVKGDMMWIIVARKR